MDMCIFFFISVNVSIYFWGFLPPALPLWFSFLYLSIVPLSFISETSLKCFVTYHRGISFWIVPYQPNWILSFGELLRWYSKRACLVTQTVKNPPAMRDTWVWFLGWEDPLEKGRQPTPVFLPRKSHGQRSLQSVGSQRGGHNWVTKHNTVVTLGLPG